ncbi:hypothetical protein BU23DRAFT_572651 [Bimuria novae-zelandiae CBS 107.79]|uniref:Uncharacterized protein n=1 Tax=Bimuria novae-zelandiae CBS 107.79 TaxID=1447943 RepID=A0A6A5UTI6_9PLEO|nr:hypothetical protein BU23DRAFT_572651 [Bimuria novae-zelandiae CBS 107.79]
MASKELLSLGERLLKPLKHDPAWWPHAKFVYEACEGYEIFAEIIQEAISRLNPHNHQTMRAALDITHFSHMGNRPRLLAASESVVIERYLADDHFGMAFILLMCQFMGPSLKSNSPTSLAETQISTFVRCHKEFVSEVKQIMLDAAIIKIGGLWDDLQLAFERSQLFIPGELLKHEAIRQHVRTMGIDDCLERSPTLMEYDAGHLAASLEINTITGYSEILALKDISGRTFFEWAASCGNFAIVDSFLSKIRDYGAVGDEMIGSDKISLSVTAIDTALELALRYNHLVVVDVIACQLGRDCDEAYERDRVCLFPTSGRCSDDQKKIGTYLRKAAWSGCFWAIKWLLGQIDLDDNTPSPLLEKDEDGKSVHQIAHDQIQLQCEGILSSYAKNMADRNPH